MLVRAVARTLGRDLDRLAARLAALPGPSGLLWILAGLVAGWWLYVPIHELLHVAGCLVAGGEVSRLEMDPLYGAHLLARIFPFVVPGSDYAGQLTGFDTGGSDLVYLSCVLMPFTLTVFPGFWLWQMTLGSGPAGPGRLLACGALLPVVAAPLISLVGDYYEAGSILVSRALGPAAGVDIERWRHDDIFRLLSELSADFGPWDGVGFGLSLLLGLVLGVLTMMAGSALGQWLHGRRFNSNENHQGAVS